MSTRIYASAQKLADAEDLDLEALMEAGQLEGTGSGDAVTKTDVEAYLEDHAAEDLPSKEDLIRRGLAEGLSNDEIGQLVRATLGETTPWENGYVSWTIGNERRQHTEWWQEHGPRVVRDRGVKPGKLEVQAEDVA